MKLIYKIVVPGVLGIVTIFGCRVNYQPPAITNYTNYLVVEGLINTTDTTIIKLSRTVKLSDATNIKAETRATITIESDANASYPLTESKIAGTYVSGSLALSKTGQYRLRIITSNGKIYLSAFVPVKICPPIDSIGYTLLPNGLQIYANTHDPTNNTRYYRWDYVETWEIHSTYPSSLITTKTDIVPRTPAQQIFQCWPTAVSPGIAIGSSEKLTQDVINHAIINTVPSMSAKLRYGYSIIVQQYALTADAFKFWQNLKTNTEDLGSIFDAQPSQIQGNIHNINDVNEPVFGYISAGTTQKKRISMLNTAWPFGWGYSSYAPSSCTYDTVTLAQVPTVLLNDPFQVPITSVVIHGTLSGYATSVATCVDCTVYGGAGSNRKPSYWPN